MTTIKLACRAVVKDGAIYGVGEDDEDARHIAEMLYGARLPDGLRYVAASEAAFLAFDEGCPENVDFAADGSVRHREEDCCTAPIDAGGDTCDRCGLPLAN